MGNFFFQEEQIIESIIIQNLRGTTAPLNSHASAPDANS
jgi:hypothetical protein